MKILVTGATGFVGSRVVEELDHAGHEVIAVGGIRRNCGQRLSVDITDPDSVALLDSVGAVDAIVHTAALAHRFKDTSKEEYYSVNVDGVTNVARLAMRLNADHFVLLSSTLVYGKRSEMDVVITESSDCRPADAYGQSKLDGELAARRVCEENNINLTILRPSPIIGEGSKGNFNRLIRAIDRKRFLMVGSGENRKSLIYVGDVALAVRKVIEQGGEKTQIFNLSADEIRMIDIVRAIGAGLETRIPAIILPAWPLRQFLMGASKLIFRRKLRNICLMLDTWLSNDIYSNDRIKSKYDFVPQTSIEDAIRRETAFYLNTK